MKTFYSRLQPTDTFINVGGLQIPRNTAEENKKALESMPKVMNSFLFRLNNTFL
jgi:hypothetical protein